MPQTTLTKTQTGTTTVTVLFAPNDAKRLARLKGVIPYQAHVVEQHARPHAGESVACGVLLNYHEMLAASRPQVTETRTGYTLALTLRADIERLDHVTDHLVQVLAEYAPRADVRLSHAYA